MNSDGEARKAVKAEEREVLLYHLARTDFLIKLLEHGLTEETTLDYRDHAIVPTISPKKLSVEQRVKSEGDLKQNKKFLMDKLGISLDGIVLTSK